MKRTYTFREDPFKIVLTALGNVVAYSAGLVSGTLAGIGMIKGRV